MVSNKHTGLLSGIPESLRKELIVEFQGIADAYLQGRWKYASLDAGRFCEVSYCILFGALSGSFPVSASKPSNFPRSCRELENHTPIQVGDHSIRILIPRVLMSMYDVRNNRNVCHVNGDVVANQIDANLVYTNAKWVLAELVRIFHATSIQAAQNAIDSLLQRDIPIIWEIDEVRRVLDPSMSYQNKSLVLLYNQPTWTPSKKLFEWVQYSDFSAFRKNILIKLAKSSKIEMKSNDSLVILTPIGIRDVDELLKKHSRSL